MKTIKIKSIVFLLGAFFSIQSYCQSNQIVADSKLLKHLVGKKYSNVSEIGDFKLKARLGSKYLNGKKNYATVLAHGEKQIITSEKAVNDKITNSKVYEILDIIVLDGNYSIAEGRLIPKKKSTSILSIHPYGTINNDSVLVAFERNLKNGKFKQIKPDKIKRYLK